MKKPVETIHSLQVLKDRSPLPVEVLRLWVEEAERHGFDALLPLIEKEGVDVVNRTLRYNAIDWLFLVGVSCWRRALLIGSDLGAAVEALTKTFQKVVVIEPNPLLFRLLEFRFQMQIADGRVHLRDGGLDATDVDLDLVWFMPTIGRSQGSLTLTKEVKTLIQDCTTRLSPRGVLVVKAVRDRGVFRNIPLPGIRYESGQGYSLREFGQLFRPIANRGQGSLNFYWLTSKHNGSSSGTYLHSSEAISYFIRTHSRWFHVLGPLRDLAVNFVTRRVSSVIVAFRRNSELSGPLMPVQQKGEVMGVENTLQRVMQATRRHYNDCRELTPLLYRSGSWRRTGRAIYLLIDAATGRPRYIVRIAKGPESEVSLRKESNSYRTLRESNRALQNLSPAHYVISDNEDIASMPYVSSHRWECRGYSFSIERFIEGVSGTAFARKSFLDTHSFDWLNWFQKESATFAGGGFDNQMLCNELSVLEDTILKNADRSLRTGIIPRSLPCRISSKILKPFFEDLESRFNRIEPFCLPISAVHGDFCQLNLLAYRGERNNENFFYSEGAAAEVPPIQSREKMGIHVFDWEHLNIGVPLFDPWLYVIGFMLLNIHGQVNRKTIPQFLTGRWKYSSRIEQCLAYYARISGIPVDLLVGYLPMALLIMYSREAHLCSSYLGLVELLEGAITYLACNRQEVWQYLDALADGLRKEIQKQ